MPVTATATSPVILFGEQADEMERFAVAELRRARDPEDRDLMHALLRHARGITALTEKWRNRNH